MSDPDWQEFRERGLSILNDMYDQLKEDYGYDQWGEGYRRGISEGLKQAKQVKERQPEPGEFDRGWSVGFEAGFASARMPPVLVPPRMLGGLL
jgi:hypothetical protein